MDSTAKQFIVLKDRTCCSPVPKPQAADTDFKGPYKIENGNLTVSGELNQCTQTRKIFPH